MPDLPMRSEAKFTELLDIWFYRHVPVFLPGSGGRFTAGGRTGFTRGRRMRGGGLTISVYQRALKERLAGCEDSYRGDGFRSLSGRA